MTTGTARTLAILFLTALVGLTVPLTATELVVWHAYRGKEKAAFEKVVQQFNQSNGDGVTVKTLAVPYDAYADKITAAVPRGKGPDVFIFAQDRLGGWIEAGNTVEPIDFYVDDEIRERFLERTLEAVTYRDIVYGLPFNFKCITLIYNKKMITKPPKTTGELVALAKKHTNAEIGQYGLAYAYSDYFYHAALMNGFGGGVFEPGPKATINRPENLKAIELMLKWYKDDKIMPGEPSTALITSLFNEGKAAMIFNGPWFLGEIESGVDYGLAVLPTIDEAGGAPMRPWMTIEGLYVAAPSKHKEEAFDFINYLTGVEAAAVMAVEGRQLPANRNVYKSPKILHDPIMKVFLLQGKQAEPMPNLAEMSIFWSPATTAMNTIVKGTANPKAAMDKAQVQVEKAVAKLRGQ
ncbi:Extracellular solute-binding protein [Sulfidibacter corallicola]|uniref:Extracellular solute-binding protein n=1 Tax=Sulfidibacter corallicola TaxID=2818388 RepID=A0A8A4TSU9_SULCO|nr:extracellular solute-binding protein [Sulfidibacter corallicola]QTD52121.1 extracellular solute-binding protein [Sulfidibacter corallicola]